MSTSKAATRFIFFSLSIMYSACDTSRHTPSIKEQYKSTYIEQFKLTYLRKLLSKSYNHSAAVREILNNDYSGFTEPILAEEDYKLIDSLTTLDNKYLIADSAEGRRRAEGAQGKRPLGFIINKLSGKWLDSLAKRRVKLNGDPSGWR